MFLYSIYTAECTQIFIIDVYCTGDDIKTSPNYSTAIIPTISPIMGRHEPGPSPLFPLVMVSTGPSYSTLAPYGTVWLALLYCCTVNWYDSVSIVIV